VTQTEGPVEVKKIIAALDKEIDRLKQARALLTGNTTGPHRKGHTPGRVRGTRMSAAARRRISAAMKKRWAERKKQTRK